MIPKQYLLQKMFQIIFTTQQLCNRSTTQQNKTKRIWLLRHADILCNINQPWDQPHLDCPFYIIKTLMLTTKMVNLLSCFWKMVGYFLEELGKAPHTKMLIVSGVYAACFQDLPSWWCEMVHSGLGWGSCTIA